MPAPAQLRSLLLGVALVGTVGCDGRSPVQPGIPEAQFTDLSVETATLQLTMLYDGVALGTGSSVPGHDCFNLLIQNGGASISQGVCGTVTRTGLIPGETTVRVRSFATTGITIVPDQAFTLEPGLNVHTIELADHAGVVQGEMRVDGLPATIGQMQGLNALNPTLPDGRFAFNSLHSGAFRLYVRPGAGTVRYLSASNSVLATAAYTVVAGETTDVGTLNAATASLQLSLTYDGIPVGTGNSVPGFNCFSALIQASGANIGQTLCGPVTRQGLAPGPATVRIRSFANANIVLVPDQALTLEPGLNVLTIELSDHVGVVHGHVEVDGAPATTGRAEGYNALNPTQADGRYAFTSAFSDAFVLYVRPGSGEVRYLSSSNTVLGTASYTVAAGETTFVGMISAETASLQITLTYHGDPIVSGGTVPGYNCFNAQIQSGGTAGTQTVCGTGTRPGLEPGPVTVRIRSLLSAGIVIVPDQTLTLEPGLNVHTVELSDHVGVVEGNVQADGQPATSGQVQGFNASNPTQADGRYFFTVTFSGDFRLFVRPGAGEVRYLSNAGIVLASAAYDVVAGETSTLGTLVQNQAITFSPLSDRTFGDAAFAVTAAATSGLPVSLEAAGACTLADATVTISGAGSCTITATQDGNAEFHPADPVSRTFTIHPAPQVIVFDALGDRGLGDSPFTLTATGGGSGNPIVFSSSTTAVCTIAGSQASLVGTGDCVITAAQAGDANHLPADPVTRSFVVSALEATISLSGLAHVYDGTEKPATATTDPEGLSVAITYDGSSDPPVQAGSYEVVAVLLDDGYIWTPAAATLEIARAAQFITFAAPPDVAQGAAPIELSASGGASGNAVNFSTSTPAICGVAGVVVTLTHVAGTCTIAADQSGDDNHLAAPQVIRTFSVANVTPQVAPFAGALLLAGETYSASGSFVDPGADAWTATVDFSTGAGPQPLALAGKNFALTHAFAAAGTYAVTVRVDDGMGAGTATATVEVGSSVDGVGWIAADVESLRTDAVLSRGEANALAATLAAAVRQLERDNAAAAVQQLRAFINQVEALRQSGRLDVATAEALIEATERVIASIAA